MAYPNRPHHLHVLIVASQSYRHVTIRVYEKLSDLMVYGLPYPSVFTRSAEMFCLFSLMETPRLCFVIDLF